MDMRKPVSQVAFLCIPVVVVGVSATLQARTYHNWHGDGFFSSRPMLPEVITLRSGTDPREVVFFLPSAFGIVGPHNSLYLFRRLPASFDGYEPF
ncbi:MAG: hypothetical protein P8017_18010 [Deltaproteobacteria bacterium]